MPTAERSDDGFDTSGPAGLGDRSVEPSWLTNLRKLCLALPEVTERLSHGAPTFFIRGKKTFVMSIDNHHGDGNHGMWCAAPPGTQAELVDLEPDRFFRPPYVGHRGWLGVRLDVDVDWSEIDEIVRDAYRCVAPAKLIAAMT